MVFKIGVESASRAFPAQVVGLEDEWDGWLVKRRKMDAACGHFIEAGQYMKVCLACIII